MRRLRGANTILPLIPTASMADIAFLLIVFFMVTTVFQVDKTSVELPTSEVRDDVARGAAFVVLVRDPASSGLKLRFSPGEGQSRDLADQGALLEQAALLTSISPSYKFVIKADTSLDYAHIDATLETLRKAGVVNVTLLTNQE